MKRIYIAGIVLVFCAWFTPKSFAVDCFITNAPTLNFGTVDPFTTSQQTGQVTLSWTCNTTTFAELLFGASATMCVYANTPPPGGINPRNLQPQPGPGTNRSMYLPRRQAPKFWGSPVRQLMLAFQLTFLFQAYSLEVQAVPLPYMAAFQYRFLVLQMLGYTQPQ